MNASCELSAVVMCFNERDKIERCLDALRFCDEVIVVDDVSTDGTWEYLQGRADVRAVQHRHTTFAAQREYGKALARGRWILTMDADEVVSPELAKAIRAAVSSPSAPDGYYLLWRNLFPATLTGYSEDWNARLLRAEKCRWKQTDNPHSPLEMEGLRIEKLQGGYVEHAAPPHVAFVIRKVVNRSLILAAQARASGKRTSGLKLVLSTVARWFKAYWRLRGWRHGSSGLVVAGLWAFEAFAKQAMILESPTLPPESMQDGSSGSYPEGCRFVEREGRGPDRPRSSRRFGVLDALLTVEARHALVPVSREQPAGPKPPLPPGGRDYRRGGPAHGGGRGQ